MYPFPEHIKGCRVMVFVDGENLAIRYASMLGSQEPVHHVVHEKGVFVWSRFLNMARHVHCDTIRRHYYTAVQGSDETRQQIHDRLKGVGIEAPRVFRKDKERGSKRVDISLAADMLGHAHRKNYDLAVLVAGDEDYVPLVDAVAAEGRRVVLWFVEQGLSAVLKGRVDHFFDAGKILFDEHAERYFG
jgi:uncharacterized LabA/DUF88 family protein